MQPGATAADVRLMIKSGSQLEAFDAARQLLQDTPDNRELQYLAVLALARSGAHRQAFALYQEYALDTEDGEEYGALGARLAKDQALATAGNERNQKLLEAARRYEAVFEKTHGAYPAINAASLYYLANAMQQASQLASKAFDSCLNQTSENDADEYYRLATLAEASVILERDDDARAYLARAMQHVGDRWADVGGTRKQLSLLLTNTDRVAVLDAISLPSVIHFCGHMISTEYRAGRFLPGDEEKVRQAIAGQLEKIDAGFGFGSLASGADIMIAEALLERGAKLCVVLPFNKEEFIEISVRPAGDAWVSRFHRCIGQAQYVTYSTEDAYLDDDALFYYTSRMAMGLAIQKGLDLSTRVYQVAIWDGELTPQIAGTSTDVVEWHLKGLPAILIDSHSADQLHVPDPVTRIVHRELPGKRYPRAILFGDVKGFSKLTDAELPVFVEHVLGNIGNTLENFSKSIISVNTWGDGLFMIMDDVLSAAECALEMQESLSRLDLVEHGISEKITMRIGAHYGPVYELTDPVLKRANFFGSHVSRTARIEPVTPTGEVYVTRQFAAELAMQKTQHYTTEYVGIMPAAKSYGDLAMYALKRSLG